MTSASRPVVDIHCHLFDRVTSVGTDLAALPAWARADVYLDAGSAGPAQFAEFADYARRTAEEGTAEVYGLVNVAEAGLDRTPEITAVSDFQPERAAEAAAAHPDVCKGLKVRAVQPAMGLLGMAMIERTLHAADQAALPVMVHFGEQSGQATDEELMTADILAALRPGDIAAHIFTGHPGGFFASDAVLRAAREARTRGVLFDVGHGGFNFSIASARVGQRVGFPPDFVSSDVTRRTSPWLNLPYAMAAVRAAGFSDALVLAAVTDAPSAWIRPARTTGRRIVASDEIRTQADSHGTAYETAVVYRFEDAA